MHLVVKVGLVSSFLIALLAVLLIVVEKSDDDIVTRKCLNPVIGLF